MRTNGWRRRRGRNGELCAAHPAAAEFQVEGRKEDCLYVGQLLDRVECRGEHRPETEPNGAWHYRQNFLIGFCRTENIYPKPRRNILITSTQ